jgi:GTPase SAR1 family protein
MAPEEALTAYELSCDVAVFVYDASNANSFEYCAAIYKVRAHAHLCKLFSASAQKYFHRTRVPSVFVANKSDRRPIPLQQYEQVP